MDTGPLGGHRVGVHQAQAPFVPHAHNTGGLCTLGLELGDHMAQPLGTRGGVEGDRPHAVPFCVKRIGQSRGQGGQGGEVPQFPLLDRHGVPSAWWPFEKRFFAHPSTLASLTSVWVVPMGAAS